MLQLNHPDAFSWVLRFTCTVFSVSLLNWHVLSCLSDSAGGFAANCGTLGGSYNACTFEAHLIVYLDVIYHR